MDIHTYNLFLQLMAVTGLIIFVALYFVKAGYGIFRTKNWGVSIPSRCAWILMELPVFAIMLLLWLYSDRRFEAVVFVFFILFQIHYFQRTFVYPFLISSKGRMPITIILMGVVFNVLNSYMQGWWFFYLAPEDMYTLQWFATPQFIVGTILFFTGLIINWHSDYIIRHLRKPGDTAHYLPNKGLYKYVTSANYLGEIIEWVGFAVLTWSFPALIFAWWTFANLVPRASAIHGRYREEFGTAVGKRKRIFPFIY